MLKEDIWLKIEEISMKTTAEKYANLCTILDSEKGQ